MSILIKDLEIPVAQLSSFGGKDKTSQSEFLKERAAKYLKIDKSEIKSLSIKKRSLDARKKSKIVYHYQLFIDGPDVDKLLKKFPGKIETAEPASIQSPLDGLTIRPGLFRHPPVIVGSGPAGSFVALALAEAGQKSIIIERGQPVGQRIKDVGQLRGKGIFNPESNYCYGEGGAGTFSDGKLTCGRNHPLIRYLFRRWVDFGAPEDILYEAHPHIGTDYLLKIAKNQRDFIEAVGSEYLFNHQFKSFKQGASDCRFEVELSGGLKLKTDHLILAFGHSARETYRSLIGLGVAMEPKPFAVGARIEHPQEVIDQIQFGSCEILPAAEYKLTAQHQSPTGGVGRGIWTFCMCPGGHLLPTGAEAGHLAINGMSYHARNSGFANAAVVVNVLREDFYRGDILDGAKFQADIEQRSFQMGGGNYHSPAQRLVDFMEGKESQGNLKSTYKPGVTPARVDKLLPAFIVEALRSGLKSYNQRLRGYLSEEAIIAGVESKTSAPIIIQRTRSLESISHPGLYPCGEGAGFAGGIVSAALDGARVGQALLKSVCE